LQNNHQQPLLPSCQEVKTLLKKPEDELFFRHEYTFTFPQLENYQIIIYHLIRDLF